VDRMDGIVPPGHHVDPEDTTLATSSSDLDNRASLDPTRSSWLAGSGHALAVCGQNARLEARRLSPTNAWLTRKLTSGGLRAGVRGRCVGRGFKAKRLGIAASRPPAERRTERVGRDPSTSKNNDDDGTSGPDGGSASL
jgi:hypothetical protein